VKDWLRRYAVLPVLFDAGLLMFLFPAAYAIRFDFQMGPQELEAVRRSLPLLLFFLLGSGLLMGSYAVSWARASSLDYLRQAAVSLIGTLLALAAITLATRFEEGYSRSAFLIFGLLFIAGQATARGFQELGMRLASQAAKKKPDRKAVMIYGAGKRGRLLAEACEVVPELAGYRVVAFFDDNEELTGKRINGIPIYTPANGFSHPPAHEFWVSTPAVPKKSSFLRNVATKNKVSIKKLILELRPHQAE